MTERVWKRIALGYLAVVSLQIGVWAQFAPKSFYDGFPGLGRAWVDVDGPYNEHLVRDVGGLYLGLGVLIVAAIVTLARSIVITASVAVLASGVPHLIYHVTHRAGLGAGDLAASLTGQVLIAAIPIALLVGERRPDERRPDDRRPEVGSGVT
ncbi:MAG: DUF4345 family protein [Ilumatobacteraceae bacterium]|nr:DUF4345 family protein [Ilumatobacteraceae bacterium]